MGSTAAAAARYWQCAYYELWYMSWNCYLSARAGITIHQVRAVASLSLANLERLNLRLAQRMYRNAPWH